MLPYIARGVAAPAVAGRAAACLAAAATTILIGASAAPASAPAGGWSITPSPNPRAGNGGLNTVSCPTASVCTAVGFYVRESGRGVTLAERRSGGRWTVQSTPNPAGAATSALNGVSCPSGSACTAVGEFVAGSGAQRTLAERWSGSSWRIQPTPSPPGSPASILAAVACPAADSCTAVGASNSKLLVERWDGARWRIQPAPVPAGAQFSGLSGVTCTAVASCIAVGDYVTSSGADVTLAERWNGARWSIQTTRGPGGAAAAVLFGVSCTSRSSCMAAGTAFNSSGQARMFSERWNGATWHLRAVPAPSGAQSSLLLNVSCAASSCEAVGEYNDSSGATVTLGEGWNGSTWHAQPTPHPARASGNSLSGVSCPAASDCTAVGVGNGAGTPVTLGDRWRDGRWRPENVPSPAGAAENQLNGIACPAAGRCVAVGAAGPTRGVVSTEALRWNGRDWRIQPTPNPAGSSSSTLFAVACPAADRCTAVGTSNSKVLAERRDGARWRIRPAPVPPGAQFSELNAVSCTAAAACIAVGDYVTRSGADVTLAERWNGTDWRLVPAPTPPGPPTSFFTGVACPAPAACIAVGTSLHASGNPAGTFAERWNGTSWRVQRTQRAPGGFLASLWCQSATACIATGSTNAGTLAERLTGTTWAVVHTPSLPGTQGDFLGSVSCTSLSACTAAGGVFGFPQQTLAERWNGARWRIQPTPPLPGIGLLSSFSVACPAPSACIAAGGFAHDGPASVSLAERWRGTGTSTAHPAPAASSPRADRGIAGCVRAAMDAGVAIRAAFCEVSARQSDRPGGPAAASSGGGSLAG